MTGTTRRRLLTGAAGTAGLVAFGAGDVWASRPTRSGTLLTSRAPLPAPFRRPLPIPRVLTPGHSPDHPDADYYEIEQRVGTQQILPGLPTRVWGYEGTMPGPTIVSRRGRRTVVKYTNRLPVPAVTHLHGGHTPAEHDGFPTDFVFPVGTDPAAASMAAMPGMGTVGMPNDPQARTTIGTRVHEYPLDQRAATLWYHDHRMGFTGPGVWRGLLGVHIVTDDEERALRLPAGDRDVPLVLTDRAFDADGSFRYPALDPDPTGVPGVRKAFMNGVLGDVLLVNGAPWPVLEVAPARYRFRVVNASNARRYLLALDPSPAGPVPLVQIGSDGGLLARPYPQAALAVAPAERFDVVVNFSHAKSGQEFVLRNELGSGPTALVMKFRVTGAAPEPSQLPDTLSPHETLDPATAVATRDFLFQNREIGWTINGRPFEPTHPVASARRGDVEIWRFVTDLAHPVHVHLNHFQVVSRQGNRPGPSDAGWKDTVDLSPAEEVAVAIRFDDYAGRFLMHCHNLEHEDMAMMAAITIT